MVEAQRPLFLCPQPHQGVNGDSSSSVWAEQLGYAQDPTLRSPWCGLCSGGKVLMLRSCSGALTWRFLAQDVTSSPHGASVGLPLPRETSGSPIRRADCIPGQLWPLSYRIQDLHHPRHDPKSRLCCVPNPWHRAVLWGWIHPCPCSESKAWGLGWASPALQLSDPAQIWSLG